MYVNKCIYLSLGIFLHIVEYDTGLKIKVIRAVVITQGLKYLPHKHRCNTSDPYISCEGLGMALYFCNPGAGAGVETVWSLGLSGWSK